MKVASSMQAMRNSAADALKSVLHHVSQVKIKDIELDSPRADLKVDILAYLDVQGHSHTLVCKVRASGRPDHVRTALKELQGHASEIYPNATPVLIAPYLSEEARALCWESKAGFLDLEGNARLELGDVFIGKRSLPQATHSPDSPISRRRAEDAFQPVQIAGAA